MGDLPTSLSSVYFEALYVFPEPILLKAIADIA